MNLSLYQIAVLLIYSVGLALGQVLFKTASAKFPSNFETAVSFFLQPTFIMAMALYVSLVVAWVWILSFVPLSRGYPFTASAFVWTAIFGTLLFNETITIRFIVGVVVLAAGLWIIATSG